MSHNSLFNGWDRLNIKAPAYSYRNSYYKDNGNPIITKTVFVLKCKPDPNLAVVILAAGTVSQTWTFLMLLASNPIQVIQKHCRWSVDIT